jgi:hypothetical protein
VPGNRDRREGLRESFIRWSCLDDDEPFVQYAVDDLPVRLLGLDSQSGTSQWPIVPMLQCGLFRSNFSLAILGSLSLRHP